jgi:hypothetical protein
MNRMAKPTFTFDLIGDIEAGQALARQMHNEVIAPANPSIEVHMFAIAVLTAEFAVRRSETMAEAEDLVDAIADAARSALQSGFNAKSHIRRKPQ